MNKDLNGRKVRIKAKMVDFIQDVADQYDESFLDALYRIIQTYRDNKTVPSNTITTYQTLPVAPPPPNTTVSQALPKHDPDIGADVEDMGDFT